MFKCTLCGNFYQDKARLKEHLNRNHKIRKSYSNFIEHTEEKLKFMDKIKQRWFK